MAMSKMFAVARNRWLLFGSSRRPSCMLNMLGVITVALLCSLHSAQAAGTVTNASYTELLNAVRTGGEVFFRTNMTILLNNRLVISNHTTINGGTNTIILSGNDAVRLFEVRTNINFKVINVTLSNGRSSGANGTDGSNGDTNLYFGDNGGHATAGGDAVGGAIQNHGNMELINCRVVDNEISGGNGGNGGRGGDGRDDGGEGGNGAAGGIVIGGAIYNVGFLLLTNCTVSGNSVNGGNAGNGGEGGNGAGAGRDGDGARGGEALGGGIYNLGVARLFSSTLSQNITRGGNSTKGGSRSSGQFGQDGDPGGSGLGGGIYNTGIVAIVNCTFAQNEVYGGDGGDGGNGPSGGGDGGNGGLASGGGLYSVGTSGLTNCTFSANSAFGGINGISGGVGGENGSPGLSRGGNIARSAGTFVLANSILANAGAGTNAFGTITDLGFNVSSDNSLNLTNTGSLKNVTNVNLTALGDFGGPTFTILPMNGSPAINRGAVGGICLPTDQRGTNRTFGPTCDAGAVETSGLTILTQPQDKTAFLNEAVEFSVEAGGESPLGFQWQFGTNNISGATTNTLFMEDLQVTNSGGYRVIVTGPSGSVTSSVATLTVFVSTALESSSIDGMNFLFSLQSATGQTYILEYKNTLADPAWTRLRTNAGTGDVIPYALPTTGTTSRFFRVLIQ
jgi:hypothetical protein